MEENQCKEYNIEEKKDAFCNAVHGFGLFIWFDCFILANRNIKATQCNENEADCPIKGCDIATNVLV